MNETNASFEIFNKPIKEKYYWEENLSGPLIKTNFPYDTEIIENDFTKEKIEFMISKEAFQGLQKLSGYSHYRLHVLLIASINVLLYKYSGNEDIIVGSPIYRQQKEGVFINPLLPLRNTVKGDITLKQLIIQVTDSLFNANENQNYPVEKILNHIELKDVRDSLLDVMVILENIHDKRYVEQIPFNMTFVFHEDNDTLLLSIEYNPNKYRKSTVERIAKNLDHTLKDITDDVKRRIKEVNILTPEQFEEILIGFNTIKEFHFEDKLLIELFEDQVMKTPNNNAIEVGDKRLTYQELNEKANQLARTLLTKGHKPNDVVGLMIEPSVELAVGFIAILKAGTTYLPLDPLYPVDRLKYMISDTMTKLVITDKKYFHVVNNLTETIDIKNQELFQGDKSNLNIVQKATDLAYIIYTSGSTGKPKGVMVEHSAISKTILWRKEEYCLKQNHTVLQLVSYSFDAFIGGFFTPLVSGSRIVLLNNEEIKNINIICKYINEKNITHVHGVPVLVNMIMEEISRRKEENNLQIITVGGDRPPLGLIQTCVEKNVELVNEYGPTENTIISTIFRNMNKHGSNIGKPIYDTKIYVIDQDDNLCPIGVIGEICISGGRLASGYLNQPQLTTEKFVENPFVQGEIMYRTGDLAKRCADGNIDFIGRKDFQVKIRGFRVELGEIEAKILLHPNVKQAVVIAREYENGTKYICAYFVSDQKVTSSELKDYLSTELPEYMIPSHFMQISEIPVTINGKIDRKFFPLPERMSNKEIEYAEPRTDIEEKIATVWKTVLGDMDIGIYDNFFSIGGDSLKAIKAASMLAEQFKIEVNDIYKYQTIQVLASKINYLTDDLTARIETYKKGLEALEHKIDMEQNEEMEKDFTEKYNLYKKKIERYKDLNFEKVSNYKNILLTGATGYVGIYLLKELIEFTDSKIYILIRGKNIKEAEERFTQKATFYFGEKFHQEISNRIKILCGDISENFLGLEEEIYETIAMEIDCIINSAAFVKHYGKYEKFNKINVEGTKNLIYFSQSGKKKDFNHISTTTISDGIINGVKQALFTEFETDIGQKSNSYYSQTKLESEKIIMAAMQNNINIKIFRLGNVSFNYETGEFQENFDENAMNNTLKSYIKLNVFPNIDAKVYNFSFVDQLAKSVVLLFNKPALNNEVFHIYNPYQVSFVNLANLLREEYPSLKVQNFGEFLEYISQNFHNEELRPYIDNILLYMDLNTNGKSTQIITFNDKTNYILDKLGFKWSHLDYVSIKKMLQFWEKVDYI